MTIPPEPPEPENTSPKPYDWSNPPPLPPLKDDDAKPKPVSASNLDASIPDLEGRWGDLNQDPPVERAGHTRSILAEADDIINGDRNSAYGDATPAFTEYAKGASVIFGVEVNAKQVALFMTWIKVCREVHKPKRDNRVDAAGYIGLADQIEEGTK